MQKQPVQRWPLGAPRESAPQTRDLVVLTVVLGLGLAGALLRLHVWERVALVVASLGGLYRFGRVLRWRRSRRPRGEVAIDAKGVVRHERRLPAAQEQRWRTSWMTTRVCEFDAPFGVTLLANHLRTSALVAFTTPEQTRFLNVRVEGPEDAAAASDVLARATTIPDGDANGLGEDTAMAGADAAELVRAVERRAASALARMYLSGSRGESIVLDGAKLEVADRRFDLRAPLEWRGFMFHEAVGSIATIYQATWVRQGTLEVVLVAPMPPEVTTLLASGPRDLKESAQRALVRDLKLMQSLPDAPPPREMRVAIERLFMLPLRQALDRAPKAPHAVPPTRALNPSA